MSNTGKGKKKRKKTFDIYSFLERAFIWINNNRQLSAVILINVMFASFFMYMTAHTGLYGDDYGYMYVFTQGEKLSDNRVDSLSEVLSSQAAHYSLMNGRSVAHSLLQAVLIHGRWLFNIVNTAMYTLLGIGLYLLIRDKKEHRPFRQLIVYLLPWLAFPDFGNVFFVSCYSANYLWTMTIIVWFILPFRLLYGGRDIFSGRKYPGIIAMLLCGIVSGWCSENGSAAMLFVLGCMGLYYLLAKKKIPTWCYSGFAGALIGFIMMIKAPGYRIRSDRAPEIGLADRLAALVSTRTMMPYGCLLFVLMLCCGYLLMTKRSKSPQLRRKYIAIGSICSAAVFIANLPFAGLVQSAWINLAACIPAIGYAVYMLYKLYRSQPKVCFSEPVVVPAILIVTAFVANMALWAVPITETRSELPFLLFITPAAAVIFDRTTDDACRVLKLKNVKRTMVMAAALYSFISLFAVSIKTGQNYRQFVDMERYIRTEKSSGHLDITIPEHYVTKDRHVANNQMTENDPEYWINKGFCQYYGISSVTFSAGIDDGDAD